MLNCFRRLWKSLNQRSEQVLVLSRKKDQWIDIGGGFAAGGVSFVIVEIRGDKVRVGVSAPKDIKVDRREVTEAIEAEKAAE
jgi:carbon storage regulator